MIASSHVLFFSPSGGVPKGYMALGLFFVSARTIKRHLISGVIVCVEYLSAGAGTVTLNLGGG